MLGSNDDPKMGYYLQISQVGMEMVAPIVLGIFADSYWDTSPWLVTIGAVIGCVGGIVHLVVLGNREPKDDEKKDGPT